MTYPTNSIEHLAEKLIATGVDITNDDEAMEGLEMIGLKNDIDAELIILTAKRMRAN